MIGLSEISSLWMISGASSPEDTSVELSSLHETNVHAAIDSMTQIIVRKIFFITSVFFYDWTGATKYLKKGWFLSVVRKRESIKKEV